VESAKQGCQATREDGLPCRAAPGQDSGFCFMHDPEHADEAKEARRLGGLRRRRERTVQAAYDLESLETVEKIRRLVEIAALDALGLENSVSRSRSLIYAASVAAKLLEVGELEERLRALEEAVRGRDVAPAKGRRR
jgi:hypothetical protein